MPARPGSGPLRRGGDPAPRGGRGDGPVTAGGGSATFGRVEPDADPTRPVVRASDADREATVTRLQRAVAEGRIDLTEFGERVEAAYVAGTHEDLAALVADLPPDAPPPVEIVGMRAPRSSA